jgi:uncharacterized protein (DUF58 family)
VNSNCQKEAKRTVSRSWAARFFTLSPYHLVTRSPCHLPASGRYFLLVAFVLLGIGMLRRINLLILLADALLMMAFLNLLAAGRSVRGLRARRRMAEWLFARTPCTVEVQVSNPNRHGRLGLHLDDGGPDEAATWFLDWLPKLGSTTRRRDVVLPRRGRCTWRAVRARSGYPFGLVERRVLLVPEEEMVVLPCLGWLHRGRFLRHLRNLAVQPQYAPRRHPPHPHPAAQAEFHGLRSYQSGDSPRLIHWRTSARRGALMVREFEDEPSDNLLLVVDPTLPAESDYWREQFEETVSLTASICWEWCRRHGDRLVLATATADPAVLDGLTGPAHARRVLVCLAVLECGTGPADPTVIARLQRHRLPPAITVLIALGRSTLADPLRRALGRRVNCLDATHTDRFDFYTPPK